jgi:hypothetical protein
LKADEFTCVLLLTEELAVKLKAGDAVALKLNAERAESTLAGCCCWGC